MALPRCQITLTPATVEKSMSGNQQTARNAQDGGFDYEFEENVHPRFLCAICSKVMKDPHLAVCCGRKFCCSCLENRFVKNRRKRLCPHCRSTNFQNVLDKGMKSEIESFKIYCPSRGMGCKWTGEIRDLKQHLLSDDGCEYYELECPNNCISLNEFVPTRIIRKIMKDHLAKYCAMRKLKCWHCTYMGIARDMTVHESHCTMIPANCPNGCEVTGLRRQSVQGHLKVCELEVIPCTRADEGCPEKIQRQFLVDHLDVACNYRPVKCKYCDYAFMLCRLPSHEIVCKMFPIACGNGCKVEGIVRGTLSDHLKECPQQEVSCKYSFCGCTQALKRSDVKEHTREFAEKHLELMEAAHAKVTTELCEANVAMKKMRGVILKELFKTKRVNNCKRSDLLDSLKELLARSSLENCMRRK